ncbi:hypothetical protein HY488_02520 [Candidatus Woesearchaeota archaeon]|nr:hypothetical protein [Candidatus Woesearchaeota archaeon]
MPKTLHEKLREKGWSEEEIAKTVTMMQAPEKLEKHQPLQRKMNLGFYWMFLIILTVINFFVSVALIPLLLILQIGQLFFIVVIVGFAFGMLFNLIIWDIEHLETKHHVGAALFLPALALVSILLIVTAANRMAEGIIGGVHQNAMVIAGMYVFAFLLPYLISIVKRNIWKG